MEEKVLTNKKHGMLMLVILLALYALSVFMLLKSAMSDNLAVMAICIAYILRNAQRRRLLLCQSVLLRI